MPTDDPPPDWLRQHPLVFVEDLADPRLDPEDLHHLQRSLRLEAGAPISVADGSGRWQPARLAPTAEPVDEVVETPQPQPPLTVAFTPVKGQKPEWVVQKLTELGVDRIVALVTDRSVVRWDGDRRDRHLARWPRVIREAAMQSRQLRLPTFGGPLSPQHFARENPTACLADPSGQRVDATVTTLMIGPEGGWSDAERALGPLVTLPGGVLRAETAAVVGAAVLADRRSAG